MPLNPLTRRGFGLFAGLTVFPNLGGHPKPFTVVARHRNELIQDVAFLVNGGASVPFC
jgi:hypothetical protein